MRITLFGATGLVGNALMRESPSGSIAGLSSKGADIRKPEAIAQALAGTRPDWIILPPRHRRRWMRVATATLPSP